MQTKLKTLPAQLLTLILVVLIFLRFYRLDVMGIGGSDNFFYWQTAFNWYNGNWELTEHFRPFIYWIHSKTFLVTGPNDWIIRYFNVTCDVLAGLGMIYLGWLSRRSWLLGLAGAIAYFSLPEVLGHAKAELVHSPSSLFIVCYLISNILWFQTHRWYLLLLSGFFLSLAWHTHPDLAVLGASATLGILIKHFFKDQKEPFSNFIKSFCLFLAGYFSVFAAFSLRFGVNDLIANLLYNQRTQGKSQQNSFLWRFGNFSYHYILENLGLVLSILFLVSIIYFFYKSFLKGRFNTVELLLLLTPVTYLFFCSLLFSRYMIPRLFIPMTPAVLLFTLVQVYDLLLKNRLQGVMLSVFALMVMILFPSSLKAPFHQGPSLYKLVHERYNELLSEDSRLLIAPISLDHIHSPFTSNVYLNGTGLYLASTEEKTLDEVIEANRITHVWIGDIMYDRNVFGVDLKFSYEERLISLFNMDPKNYSVDQEKQAMRDFLKSRGAKLIHQSDYGEVYELRK